MFSLRHSPWPALLLLSAAVVVSFETARADEPSNATDDSKLRDSINHGLVILQKGARNYPSHRECFACHHQTLPLLGMTTAGAVGLPIDEPLQSEIVDFTQISFRDKIEKLQQGEGIGGKGLTVGYGLWTLRLGQFPADDLTTAMVTYLLKTQESDGHWPLHSIRPPAEESKIMSTVVAASGIRMYANPSQRAEATAALDKARGWLSGAKVEFHEDQVARVWGLHQLGGDTEEQLAAGRAALLASQRSDGGWAPSEGLESDAYATGSTLYVLLETADGSARYRPAPTKEADLKGVARPLSRATEWLLKNQCADGSWHVVTRATPVQLYFDNGDPHGKDQFISLAATGWATAALAKQLQLNEPRPGR
jgi:N-acyl-D-amino-acid deacylase